MTRDHFTTFADPLPEPMLLLAEDGRILAGNRAIREQLRLTAGNLQQRYLHELVEDPPNEVAEYLRRCARSGSMVLGILRLRGVDPIECRAEGSRLREKATTPGPIMLRLLERHTAARQFVSLNTRVEELGREVQRRRAAELESRRNEERLGVALQSARLLASIVESSEDAIIRIALDGSIQSWNAAAVRVFGYSPEEAIGQHIGMIIPADRADEESRIIARLQAGEQIKDYETVRVRRDGTPIIVSLIVSPVRDDDGRVVGAAKISRDITAQRQLEERERGLAVEAAAADAKFRAFFEQGALIAAIVNTDGRVVEPNRLSLEACGYAREDVVGRLFWECPWWSPSPHLVERVHAAWRQAVAGETVRTELPYFIADGSERLMDFILLPIKDDLGRVMFLAPTATDITDRKRAEDALLDADRRKDEFLATLAHELRNPLAPVRNAVQILQMAEVTEAESRWARDVISRQVQQMTRLIDDLMDLSRISRGTLELRRERVELGRVIHSAVETSQPLIDERRHDLTVTLPREPVLLDGDLTRLAQVFANLLNNAAKYTDPGGTIRLTAERQGTQLLIAVSDTGMGIPGSQLAGIFEMFSQSQSALSRAQGGLGIGLSLVKRLVDLHGGSIEAQSAGPGQGSTFLVRLPVAEPVRPRSEVPNEEIGEARASLRILIVDDNRDGADSLAMMLGLMGHELQTAYDGEEAVEAARVFRPQVVLLDIGLPKINGYEACQRIREQPWGRDMVVIAITGWGQKEDRSRSQAAGFDEHLVKPVDPRALLSRLHGLAATRR